MPLEIEQLQIEYTLRCKACLTPKFKMEYYVLVEAARSYGQAIKDILGGEVWLEIITRTSLLMPADVATVAGIPINFPELEKV